MEDGDKKAAWTGRTGLSVPTVRKYLKMVEQG